MTLLELLVQELPELGGWPKDADEAYWHAGHRLLNFYFDGGHLSNHAPIEWREKISLIGAEFEPDESDNTGQTVTREQYETALAASKQPTWGGDGLPPVGTECEWLASGDHEWMRVKVLAYHEDEVWLQPLNGAQSFTFGNPYRFRPIQTEAERKREEAIKALTEWISEGYSPTQIYDLAIAKGEIPGVKLAD